jgi:hypothetical protein
MGREVRRVPANWQHPKQIRREYRGGREQVIERHRPMLDSSYEDAVAGYHKGLADWLEGHRRWGEGFYRKWDGTEVPRAEALRDAANYVNKEREQHAFSADYREEELRRYETGLCSWAEFAGEPPRHPDPDDYMPSGPWFQLFETVSEGTPLPPPFETEDGLVFWLSNNPDFWGTRWSREAAENIVRGGWAPSLVVTRDGGEVRTYEPHEQHLLGAGNQKEAGE